MSPHLNFHFHILQCEPRNSKVSPNWLMIRTVLFQAPDHCLQRFFVRRHMIWSNGKHIFPTFRAGYFKCSLNIIKCLFNLKNYIGAYGFSCAVPSTLTGTFNNISNSNSLAVPQILFGPLSVTLVIAVSQMRHGYGMAVSEWNVFDCTRVGPSNIHVSNLP